MPIKFSGYNFFENLRNINKFTIDGTRLYFTIHIVLIINVVLYYSILQHSKVNTSAPLRPPEPLSLWKQLLYLPRLVK